MGREYPEHPHVSAHALVRHGEQVLLVQRARPPLQGYWALPGGGIELGETVESALQREVAEETGLVVSLPRFLGYANAIDRDTNDRVRWHYVIFYFECWATSTAAVSGDDAAAIAWVTPAEAKRLQHTDSVGLCLKWAGL